MTEFIHCKRITVAISAIVLVLQCDVLLIISLRCTALKDGSIKEWIVQQAGQMDESSKERFITGKIRTEYLEE